MDGPLAIVALEIIWKSVLPIYCLSFFNIYLLQRVAILSATAAFAVTTTVLLVANPASPQKLFTFFPRSLPLFDDTPPITTQS